MSELKPSKGYPGYYDIAGYSSYAINRTGAVINKRSGEVLQGSVNPDGYCNYRITDDYHRTLTWGRHRLLGFVFKNPGMSIDGLIINHLNGMKGQDDLDNLEWTTYQGNAEHAGANGLTEKCLPVSVRDVITGEVTKYPSAIKCAMDLGLSKDAVLWRIRVGEIRVFPEGKQYRKSHSDEPWHIPTRNDERHGRSRRVALRYVKTDRTFEFEKLSDVATFLDVKLPTLSTWINNPEQPVLPGFIQLQWVDEMEGWRYVADPQLELDSMTGNKSVIVIHEATGVRTIHNSATECAKVMGIGKSTLHARLQSDGKRVIDGHRFCYYSKAI